MAGTLRRSLRHAWNAFTNQEVDRAPQGFSWDNGGAYAGRPDRLRAFISNERSIIAAIYARMSVDIASVDIRHVRLDDEKRFKEDMSTDLNDCLTVEANLDQSAHHFMLDIAWTLLNHGTIAIVPVDTTLSPLTSGGFDIRSMRVGSISQWYPSKVKVNLYNEKTGRREDLILPKKLVAIVENPFYAVMNEPNSTLQRLIRKLNLLDTVDEKTSSGKLDLIVQLPYVVKTDSRRQQAEQRRKDLENQLVGSKYGVAYTDGTEKVIQLNRPVENNLLKQVEYLMTLLYSQLGITAEIMNGTADEAAMLNYNNRTIKPILDAISGEMKRKFLTKTARTQGQSIEYYRDPFQLVPLAQLAELVDKFTRNEVFSSNEMRQFIGAKPSKDPKADELRNSNLTREQTGADPVTGEVVEEVVEDEPDDGEVEDAFADVNKVLDGVFEELGVEG